MASQNTATLTFNINGIISNIGQIEKQIAGLSNVPLNIGDKLKKEIAGAKAETDKLLKSQQRGTSNKSQMQSDDVAFARLIKHYERINELQRNLATNHMASFVNPTDVAELENLRKQLELTKKAIDKMAQEKIDLLIKGEPELQKMLGTFKDANGQQITDSQQILDLLRQRTKELESQQALQKKAADLEAHKVDAAAALARAQVTTRTSKTGVTTDVFKSGGKGAFLADLKHSVPDIYALMIEKVGATGSLAQFKAFLDNGIDSAVLEINQSIPNFDPALFKNFQEAMERVELSLQNPDVNADRLEQEYADLGKQALLAAQNIDEFAKKNAKALGDITGEGLAQGGEQRGILGGDIAKSQAETDLDNTTRNWQSKVKQLLGFGAVLTQVSRMVRQAIAQVKELDAAMTQIAVVTNFTTEQLWGQIDAYMALAQQYGVTTTGVYEVSQLYYQQGLNTNEVMKMTTETLKMAKIAGLDYAKATDYMTVAIRGFKLDVEDAGRVVDVYSKLAAIAATDTRELAVAMSKTASIAESAGMSIEATSSFLTLMIETTREAPENLGTAMKTIIARFQEMKKSPIGLVDVEGEEVSLNKVDTALQTVGISLTDAAGQFKDLDTVIFELSGKWESLDRNTQRYIATTVAGSRQQSRFLALMSDNQRLTELYTESLDSEDAALLQYAKTLDSIESKANQLSTSFQQFYMSILNGPVIGGVMNLFNGLLKTLNKLPKAISGPAMIVAIKLLGVLLTTAIAKIRVQLGLTTAQVPKMGLAFKTALFGIKPAAYVAKHALGGLTVQTSMLTVAMHGLQKAMGIIGLVLTAISIGAMIFDAFNKDIEDLKQKMEDSKVAAAELKKEYKDLVAYEEKLAEVEKNKGDSAEAYQAWIDLNQEIADLYPELIARIDGEGNAIVDLGEKYRALRLEKEQAAVAGAKTFFQDTLKLNLEQLKKLNLDSIVEAEEKLKKAQEAYKQERESGLQKIPVPFTFGSLQTDERQSAKDFRLRYKSEAVDTAAKAVAETKQLFNSLDTSLESYLSSWYSLAMASQEFSNDIAEKVGKNSGLFDALSKTTREEVETQFLAENPNKTRADFYQELKDNPALLDNALEKNYASYISFIENNTAELVAFLGDNKSFSDLSKNKLTEVKNALTDADEAVVKLLEELEKQAETQIKYWTNSLISAGYTDGDETTSLADDLADLPPYLAAKLVEQAKAIVKTGVADADGNIDNKGYLNYGYGSLYNTIQNGIDNDGNAIIDEAYREQLLNLMASSDLTSWYGTQEFIQALIALDGVAGEQADKLLAEVQLFAEGQVITLADISAAGSAYGKKLEEISKLWKDNGKFDPATIKSLVDSGTFAWGDFNLETSEYKYGYDKFLKTYLTGIEEQFALIDRNGLSDEALAELEYNESLIALWKNNLQDTVTQSANKEVESTMAQIEKNAETNFKVESKILEGSFISSAEYANFINSLDLGEGFDINSLLNEFGEFDKTSWDKAIQLAMSQGLYDVDTFNRLWAEWRGKHFNDANKELEKKLSEPFKNAKTYADIMVKKLNSEDVSESDILSAINDFEFGFSSENFAKKIGGKLVYTMESLYDAANYAVANNKLNAAEAEKIIAEATEEYNREFYKLLLEPTKTISEDIYLKYQKKFTEAGIILTEGIDGWDITTPIEDYLKFVEGWIRDQYGVSSAQMADFIKNKRQTRIDTYAKTIEQTAPIAQLSTTDFAKIAKSLNEVGVSAKEAGILVEDLGFALDEFYKTANGEFKLKTSLDSIEKIQARILKISNDQKLTVEQRIKQERVLLSLAKDIKNTKTQEAIDFMSPDESKPMDANTDIYLRLLKNAGQLGDLLQDFGKEYKMSRDSFLTLIEDSSMADAIRKAFQLPADAMYEGWGLLKAVADATGQSLSSTMLTFSKEQGEAITKNLQASAEDIIKAQIAAIDVQIKALETFKALGDTEIDFSQEVNSKFLLNEVSYIDSDGKVIYLDTPQKLFSHIMKNAPKEDTIKIVQSLGLEMKADKFYDASGKEVSESQMAEMFIMKLFDNPELLTATLGLTISPKINIATMDEQEKAEYQKKLEKDLEELTKNFNPENITLDAEHRIEADNLLNTEVAEGNLQGLQDKVLALQKLYSEVTAPPPTEEETAADQVEKLNTALVNTGKEADKFKATIAKNMNAVAGSIANSARLLETFLRGWRSIVSKTINLVIRYTEQNRPVGVDLTGQTPTTPPVELPTGNQQGTARGTLNAQPGKTLVGELGPELRVSNGQYSLLGAQGAEFVNLRRGDIVFDAQKTSSLMRGRSGIRGQALAGGTGVDAAIEQLQKQKAKLQDLLSSLGSFISGAGGGGGGGGNTKAYIMQLEKWFNLLKQIKQIEGNLDVLYAKRENYLKGTNADGKKYVQTLYDENTLLTAQNARYQELITTQSKERTDKKAEILAKYGSYFSFIGDAMQIDSEAILAATKDNKTFGDELTAVMTSYEELSGAVEDNTVEYEKNLKTIEENKTAMRNLYISTENEVLSALQNMYKKEIDDKNKAIAEKTKANEKYVSALRKSLDDERKLYDKNSKADEKSRLQRRLSLLQRDTSGRNSSEISSLQEQLRKLNQDDYFAARESAIAGIESANQTEIDSMQTEADRLAEINQIKLDNMSLYWEEVQGIINQGSEAVLGFLQSWSQTYLDASVTQQEDYTNSWHTTIDGALEYARVGTNALNEMFALTAAAQALINQTTQTGPASTPPPSSSTSETTGDSPNTSSGSKYRVRYVIKDGAMGDIQVNSGSGVGNSKAEARRVAESYAKKKLTAPSYYPVYAAPVKFAKGGLADKTGLVQVDGTKSKPESFFDARATAALIDFTKVLQYQATRINFNTPTLGDTGDTVGEMTVNIEVKTGVVNNAAQAGQLADEIFERFTRLANKSGSIKVFRN